MVLVQKSSFKGVGFMKSLLDLQQNVRHLEKSMTEITNSIKDINSDIEELRRINQNIDIDYSKIENLANNISFDKHPLEKLDDSRICKIYIEMLLNIVRLDANKDKYQEITVNRLILIQWIKSQTKINLSLEDLYTDCYKIKSDVFNEMLVTIPNNYKDYFVVDALVVANLCGSANTDIYDYIAGIVAVLGIDKERLRILSLVALTALCQNISQIDDKDLYEFLSYAQLFKHYIKPEILNTAIYSFRQIIVVKLLNDKVQDFKWKVKQRQKVEKDDVVATYRKIGSPAYNVSHVTKALKSPSAGTIFRFKDNGIIYGVLSHETDNLDSIKAWVKHKIRGLRV